MNESTSECRKDCDVYEAWLKLVSDNVELVLKNTKLEAENDRLKEIALKVVEVKMYSYRFWKKAEQALKDKQ